MPGSIGSLAMVVSSDVKWQHPIAPSTTSLTVAVDVVRRRVYGHPWQSERCVAGIGIPVGHGVNRGMIPPTKGSYTRYSVSSPSSSSTFC